MSASSSSTVINLTGQVNDLNLETANGVPGSSVSNTNLKKRKNTDSSPNIEPASKAPPKSGFSLLRRNFQDSKKTSGKSWQRNILDHHAQKFKPTWDSCETRQTNFSLG